MKSLIIGASGLVGKKLYDEALYRKHNVIGTYLNYPVDNLQYLDIGIDAELEKTLNDFEPTIIFCPAGKTNVDWIEENPKESWALNNEKLFKLFKHASKRNIPVAFFSTDYIFDGNEGPYDENDKPNPLNFYGSHKLASEIALKTFSPENYYIFRTTWVFGEELQGKNFAYSIIKNLSSKKEIKVPDDMFSTPTYSDEIAKHCFDIVEKNTCGTYHLSNGEVISRYEFAKKIAQVFELDESLIKPTKTIELNSRAKRPLKAGLINKKSLEISNSKWSKVEACLKDMKQKMELSGKSPLVSSSEKSKICIFIPCYNATITLPKVLERIPVQIKERVEEIFVVDNNSDDYTYLMAIGLRQQRSDLKNFKVLKNASNFGYGGSQKIAYSYAIKQGYDMVVMLHGDAQYAPEKLPVMIEEMDKDKSIDLLFGSRMKGDPLKGGMPFHRFLGNKALTFFQNFLLGTKISEFHSGYRIFRTSALEKIPFHLCSNDYHFDTETIILFIKNRFKIAEVPIPTFYGNEKNYVKIWEYGINVLITTICYFLHTKGLRKYGLYKDGIKADTEKIFREFKTEIH